MDNLSNAIRQAGESLGFDAVGIVSINPAQTASPTSEGISTSLPDTLYERLKRWLTHGYHATMSWMATDPWKRSHPTSVLPGCRSIICVGINYWTGEMPDERPGYGRIARYAWGLDYHQVFTTRLAELERRIVSLAPGARTRSYVDTGPIMEKAWAQTAGLGWIGKHSNLVSSKFGSWLLLGEVLTTLELEPDEPGTDLCGTCDLCIRACPTQAMPQPYVVDASRCLSYATIEHRGAFDELDPDIPGRLGNRIFGCDDCLDACPYNHYAEPTQESAFSPTALTLGPNLRYLSGLNSEQFTTLFASSPIRRTKWSGLMRNVDWAIKNQAARKTPTSTPRSSRHLPPTPASLDKNDAHTENA